MYGIYDEIRFTNVGHPELSEVMEKAERLFKAREIAFPIIIADDGYVQCYWDVNRIQWITLTEKLTLGTFLLRRERAEQTADKTTSGVINDAVDLRSFLKVADKQYGWTLSCVGELFGLTAGDMGYEDTHIGLEQLVNITMAHGSPEAQDIIHDALGRLVNLCRNALPVPRKEAPDVMPEQPWQVDGTTIYQLDENGVDAFTINVARRINTTPAQAGYLARRVCAALNLLDAPITPKENK